MLVNQTWTQVKVKKPQPINTTEPTWPDVATPTAKQRMQ